MAVVRKINLNSAEKHHQCPASPYSVPKHSDRTELFVRSSGWEVAWISLTPWALGHLALNMAPVASTPCIKEHSQAFSLPHNLQLPPAAAPISPSPGTKEQQFWRIAAAQEVNKDDMLVIQVELSSMLLSG